MPNDLKPSDPKAKSILVCFAVGTEASAFRSIQQTNPGVRFYRLITGMGPDNAERKVREALDRLGVVHEIWSCGFAGGLNPDLQLGDGLFEWHEVKIKVKVNDIGHESDPLMEIQRKLQSAGWRSGQFVMTQTPLDTVDQKRDCFSKTGADAVEMESEAIARVGQQFSIPTLTLRAISDTAQESFPIPFGRFMDHKRRLRILPFIGYILTHPGVIVRLIRFRKSLEKPLETIRRGLEALTVSSDRARTE